MDAGTLNCPGCGAPAASEDARCRFCGSTLLTVACPGCLGMMFAGNLHCPHCGAESKRSTAEDDAPHLCPRCRTMMGAADVGTIRLHECGECGGIWLGRPAFEKLCAEREKQAGVLLASLPPAAAASPAADVVRYVPCPACKALMNRTRFAHGARVVIDVCKAHGIWFDKDELRQIIEFIQSGGLDRARAQDRSELEQERRRLENAMKNAAAPAFLGPAPPASQAHRLTEVIGGVVDFMSMFF